MKNTLIALAKKHGADDAGAFSSTFQVIAVSELEALFAELLQANSGNAVDERAAFEADAKDAERYRWLRNNGCKFPDFVTGAMTEILDEEDLDAAVDFNIRERVANHGH